MAKVKPFICIRPSKEKAKYVAALPYDVYNRKEAKEAVREKPLSFLNIDRPETAFADDCDMYAPRIYEHAAELLKKEIDDKTFIEDKAGYYIYEQTVESGILFDVMGNHVQTGIVACCSIDDYVNNVIKKHENTRPEKEEDRIRHISALNAQTGPIFLAYRTNEELKKLIPGRKEQTPLYDFVSDDGIRHRVWVINDSDTIQQIEGIFSDISRIYIADGHHRAASAVKVGLRKREQNPSYDKNAAFNYFLSILFPEEDLKILPYNRVVKDLNGLSKEEFLKRAEEYFEISGSGTDQNGMPLQKPEKFSIGMYMDGKWYVLKVKEKPDKNNPVKILDVSILQDLLLCPILGIEDPRVDSRIAFVGGIRGDKELMNLVDSGEYALAFSMYPTQMEELLNVADEGLLMPPKSTWFEPKLRSGLFIHKI